MYLYEIYYYKTRNWVHHKTIKADNAQQAIKKARVKHIVDVIEIK